MKHRTFDYGALSALAEDVRALGVEIPLAQHTDAIAKRYRLGGTDIKNRLLAQPIEGFDAMDDGSPSPRSIARYATLSRAGYAVIWMESISISAEGRSNPLQLWLTPQNVEYFRKMLDAVRAASDVAPYIVAQLTHSGRYAKQQPISAFHNPRIPKPDEHIATDDELEAIEQQYAEAALLAERAGFDAVDIRACHGYLINELFAAYERPGRYGGSFENRVRMLTNIVNKLRTRVGIDIGVRLNVFDGLEYPYGWGCARTEPVQPDAAEPMRLIAMLYASGVRLLNISSGIGACSPYVLRPYDSGGMESPEHPLEGVARMLDFARQAKRVAPDACVIASALTWLREFGLNAAAGGIEAGWFDLAGFGRQSIAYPNYALDALEGRVPPRERLCTTCCGCTALIKKSGSKLRCIRNPEVKENRS